ncbi:MAG: SPASM domain-containing protein [Candidatus Omnitrophica bacterium]|nr:SPASM domain-containing protein [Candidatus Omnitrophota bacterium]
MPAIAVTTKIGCKVGCNYCPQGMLVRAYRKKDENLTMSTDTFKICVDRVPSHVFIHFAGMSEPWLNPHCTEMLLYANEKGHPIRVFTTLVDMPASDIAKIEHIPFEAFEVHLPSAEGAENIPVDEKYLATLRALEESKIKAEYHVHGKSIHPEVKKVVGAIAHWTVFSRAQNLTGEERVFSTKRRRRGEIGCRRLDYNVLLPNGDVLVCCMDYGMKHVIGNLLSCSYEDLFRSAEFKRIKKGFREEPEDTLCRYCDTYAYDVSLKAKILNLPFRFFPLKDRIKSKLRTLRYQWFN